MGVCDTPDSPLPCAFQWRKRFSLCPVLNSQLPSLFFHWEPEFQTATRFSLPQTVKHILALLKRIVSFSVKKDLCDGTPFSIQMPKVNNQKTKDLTPERLSELLKVIDKSENIQAANVMKLSLFTGLRRGKMFKLKWKDINFERGLINLRGPKGGSDQKIPLNGASLSDLLIKHGLKSVRIKVLVNRPTKFWTC
jgi:integrase